MLDNGAGARTRVTSCRAPHVSVKRVAPLERRIGAIASLAHCLCVELQAPGCCLPHERARAESAHALRRTQPLEQRNRADASGVRKRWCGSHARRTTSTCTPSASRPDPRFRRRKTSRTALPRTRRTPPAAAHHKQGSAREEKRRGGQTDERRAQHGKGAMQGARRRHAPACRRSHLRQLQLGAPCPDLLGGLHLGLRVRVARRNAAARAGRAAVRVVRA